MTPSELRARFPVTLTRAYLFSGGLAPAAEPVKAAIDSWLERWAYDPLYHRARYFDEWERLRACLAEVLGAEPDEIALTDNTSRGTNLAVQMIDAPPGSNVIVDETTYPTCLYAWRAKRTVELRMVPSRDRKPVTESVARLADSHTIAIAISHVSALTGFRHDLAPLAEIAHKHGAYLVVDAAQSAGAVLIDVQAMGVDLLSGTVMKWLLGPPGVGFFFVGRRLAERLPPPHVGYVGTTGEIGSEAEPLLRYRPGARRHEIGLGSLLGIPGARPAIELLLAVGLDRVQEHVLALSGRCIEGLRALGLEPFTPDLPDQRAGVVSVPLPGAEQAAAFLRRRGVDVWGYPADYLRVDPHVFNNDDDIARFLEALGSFLARKEKG